MRRNVKDIYRKGAKQFSESRSALPAPNFLLPLFSFLWEEMSVSVIHCSTAKIRKISRFCDVNIASPTGNSQQPTANSQQPTVVVVLRVRE